ncbi:hypothetical protein [Streptomyces sp. NBC_00009]|uniref:hypothetical protein n=1 Tax=Streptomyces sp. NBC_00009 TaxID=2975620 RepID=UPI003865CFA4
MCAALSVPFCVVLFWQDSRDAVVLPAGADPTPLRELRPGSVVGAIAPRRAAQLRIRFPQLTVRALRGNLDTRIKPLDQGDEGLDALVVSCAGLQRLGLPDRAAEALPRGVLMPATGAGFVIVEHRADDPIACSSQSTTHPPSACCASRGASLVNCAATATQLARCMPRTTRPVPKCRSQQRCSARHAGPL